MGGRNAANSRIRRRVSVEGPRTPLAAQRNGEFPQTRQLAEIRQHAETRQKLANSKATFHGAGGFAIFAARVFNHICQTGGKLGEETRGKRAPRWPQTRLPGLTIFDI